MLSALPNFCALNAASSLNGAARGFENEYNTSYQEGGLLLLASELQRSSGRAAREIQAGDTAHLGYAEGQLRSVQGTLNTWEHNICCMEAHHAGWTRP